MHRLSFPPRRFSVKQFILPSCLAAASALLAASSFTSCRCFGAGEKEVNAKVYCNPLDLPYRFTRSDYGSANGKSAREAADPIVYVKDGRAWLFASKCGAYYYSDDLKTWHMVKPTGFPTEDFAPTVAVIDGKWVLFTSGGRAIYTCGDPMTGKWTKLRDFSGFNDPDLFVDDDQRVYLYSGCSNNQPIMGQELDPKKNFEPIGEPVVLVRLDTVKHGWEGKRPELSDDEIRKDTDRPWLEGSTMIKHNGTYYLQYSTPGTEYKEYADGIYTSKNPLGPYTYAPYNPYAVKTTGYIGSAGHGCTFEFKGAFWRISTMMICTHYMFERRLGLFPVFFQTAPDGTERMICRTYLGDYPQSAVHPDKQCSPFRTPMLLSLRKAAKASSEIDEKHPASNAFDEEIRTSWAAKTGRGEWISVDFGKEASVESVQINFADHNSTAHDFLNDAYHYKIETSRDGKTWETALDRSENTVDAPHEFVMFDHPVRARYARLTGIYAPGGSVFSLTGLRFFGFADGAAPQPVKQTTVKRDANRRLMQVSWTPSQDAEFYIVRFGIDSGAMFRTCQVYDGASVTIPGLDTDAEYVVSVDAVNASGIAEGKEIVSTVP